MDEGRGSWQLPDSNDAPRQARQLVRDALHRTSQAPLVDDVVLAASELVTNAHQHGEPPIKLSIHWDGFTFLEVTDGSHRPPAIRLHDPDSPRGRGLQIVAALATEWGTRPTEAGKAVWATFEQPGPEPGT